MILRLATHAMGTRFEFVLAGSDERALLAAGEAALDEIRFWHDRLSAFQPDSLLSHINREAGRAPVRLDADLFELFTLCDRVWRESGGAFDPTVPPVCQHSRSSEPGTEVADPPWRTTGAIAFVLVCLNPARSTIAFNHPTLSLNLGAIAKGFALDRAADILRETNVPNAFLHGGTSSAIAIGPAAHAIRIRSDAEPADITLHSAALGVSAPRGRVVNGVHHILDPRTGAPSQAADTAAVIAPIAAEADAWSTALVVLGARPASMPPDMTSLIHTRGAWAIEGPAAPVPAEAAA